MKLICVKIGNFKTSKEKLNINNYKEEIGLRLIKFAANVIKLLDGISASKASKTISDQLLRNSTSVGANYEEARAAESRSDFIHKMQVSLKEMRESYYWLLLVKEASLISDDKIAELCDEAGQLRAILPLAVATAKGRGVSTEYNRMSFERL